MLTRRRLLRNSVAALLAPLVFKNAFADSQTARATVLFDAFGRPSNLKRGWGYSVFIEYGGRRILFDTGGKSAEFAHNVSELGVDLKTLALGRKVRLMPPAYVKPYVKRHKNDATDAEAICEAVSRPNMRLVET
jgi:hypothetical protein